MPVDHKHQIGRVINSEGKEGLGSKEDFKNNSKGLCLLKNQKQNDKMLRFVKDGR